MVLLNIIKDYKFVLLALFFISAFVLLITLIKKKKEHKEEVQLKKDIELNDRLFKPAQISLKFLYNDIMITIEKYVQAVYNNNPMMLPEKISKELIQDTMEKIQRKNQLGVQVKLIKYEPIEPFEMTQDNSSVYTVMFINVSAEYKIEYFTEHATYKRFISKKVQQDIVFEGTNDNGFLMKSIGEETVLEFEQKDI